MASSWPFIVLASWCSSTAWARCTTIARIAACCSGNRCRCRTATPCCRRSSARAWWRRASRVAAIVTMFGFLLLVSIVVLAARRQPVQAAVGTGQSADDRRPAGRLDPGLRAVGAADGRLADAVLGMGAQQAVPVGGHDPAVRRRLRELVRHDAALRPGHGLVLEEHRRPRAVQHVPAATCSTAPDFEIADDGIDGSAQLLSVCVTYARCCDPELWTGAAGAAMIFGAIRLRRWRDEG